MVRSRPSWFHSQTNRLPLALKVPSTLHWHSETQAWLSGATVAKDTYTVCPKADSLQASALLSSTVYSSAQLPWPCMSSGI